MTYDIDAQYLIDTTRKLIEVDSPVGYYPEIHAYLAQILEHMGYSMYTDNKATAYVRVPGKDSSKTVCLGAHLDTIGLIVRGFNDDGSLRVRQLGGINYHSIEGETVRIHCRNGNVVDGQVICNKHSVHVFADCRETPRDEDHMSISIIGDVKTADDARSLGITPGAVVAVDPHFVSYDNGYMVGRYIDDKAAVAVLLDTLQWLKQTGEVPAFDTLFAFPIFEEIGHGGAFVPDEVSEYVALDITLIGPDYDGDEHSVGIIVSDARGPYDWELSNQLIGAAQNVCDAGKWNAQVCFHYSTDASAAYCLGNNMKSGAFGMACLNTHGRERCHVDALLQTAKLTRAYVTGVHLK
ncbi:MAG: M20/M25/M40 family metallo-hydrolase [Atopobium sp.]|uniref:M20/M25/M40 family metallo-hydrolase n=1 Tax=Atopobium sp. TaxID=1872650 RepID=UPI002A765ACB|nr:M20/M25/M40 family metallo-hydrolase [Atopobium sp.]MDY2788777.1 M20/M25/M40 family metallo-hydrolase [Atopobium sp.]